MLKEEKSVISTKIMEYISKKESYEELAKIYLFKFFEGIINIDIQKTDFDKNINNNILLKYNLLSRYNIK